MKKGFTLMEMIAVVAIIGVISIVALPPIINQLTEKKGEVSDTTLNVIYNAADLYMSNKQTTYIKVAGATYCVSLDELVSSGYLTSPITDFKTGNEISLTKYVKTTINSYKEYDDFQLSDTSC